MRRLMACVVLAAVTLGVVLTSGAGGAMAAGASPRWMLMTIPTPTDFHAKDPRDFYEIAALNNGTAATSGEVVVTNVLPKGVTVDSVTGLTEGPFMGPEYTTMACKSSAVSGVITVVCNTSASVGLGRLVVVKIDVSIPSTASGSLEDRAVISGGGAATDEYTSLTPVTPASVTAPFGVTATSEIVGVDGTPAVQAGSHPFAYTTMLAYNTSAVDIAEKCGAELGPPQLTTAGCAEKVGDPKNVEVSLPPGLVGDPAAVPECSQQQFQSSGYRRCAPSTQVGVVDLSFFGSATERQLVPVYNLAPPEGEPAELGFSVSTLGHVGMFFHLRPDGTVAVTVSEATQFLPLRAAIMTIWGVPAAEAHTPLRMSEAENAECAFGGAECASSAPVVPFLTMPTSCPGTPLPITLGADSWEEPLGSPLPPAATSQLPAVGGCEALSLSEPAITVAADTTHAGSPAAYSVGLQVPQNQAPEGLATPQLRNVEVEMPEGTVVSPSAANGLIACTMRSEPGRPEGEFGLNSGVVGKCPQRSSLGTVTIDSPLIALPVTGQVYVGEPECGPCTDQQIEEGKMLRLLIEAKLPEPEREAELTPAEREALKPAVLIKLAGHTMIDRRTGRLTTVFMENPQLPFDELTLTLDGGPDAPLVNPSACGPIRATAHLTAWSALFETDGKVSDPGSQANIASGPLTVEGCATPGFSPSFVGGMTTSQRGGAHSDFAVSLSRPDGDQPLGSVTMRTPPGLAGMLSKVQLCGEPEANEGTCSAASQIGTANAVVGPGSEPYPLGGGRVYLTGPYGGGPFGLSIVMPAQAGPFDLAGLTGTGAEGHGTVVVRGSIKVDPRTAALTITTGSIPTQLAGIPLDIQRVNVEVNREGFMFNPTNCEQMSIDASVGSSTGSTANLSYPFQAVNCAALPFTPGFTVQTRARHTRRFGAYLAVTVTSGEGQANIRSVHVELPKVLPAREVTLKQACLETQFIANPAGCPAGSFVGTAVAHTPVLPVPLTGPAIFVSHGGAAFPDMDVVLQGDGVTVDLAGTTNIVKGITSSDFRSVPDVPVSNFELRLPESSHSALAATANLCTKAVTKRIKVSRHGHVTRRKRRVNVKRVLKMPIVITGQNGAVIKRSTTITVRGCKVKTRPKHKSHHPRKHQSKR